MTDHELGHEPALNPMDRDARMHDAATPDTPRGAPTARADAPVPGPRGHAHEHALMPERAAPPTPPAAVPVHPGAPAPELDRIRITRMHARGHHGVFEHERRDGQDFYVDAEAWVDAAAASASDHIGDTLHYGEWMHALHAIVVGEPVDLIETLAERLAEATFAFDDAVAVRITVHKPQAPVALDFEDVAVSILRHRPAAPAGRDAASAPGVATHEGMSGAATAAEGPVRAGRRVRQAVIALGANLGDRDATLTAALTAISELPDTKLVAASSLYETPALTLDGVSDEAPAYRNAVVLVDTALPAIELLRALHRIEGMHGRTRETRWGSRTLDLDLIQVTGELSSGELQLPHPRAHERAFVLAPWLEVDSGATLVPHGPVAVLRASATDEVRRVTA